MIVQHNLQAMNANRMLGITTKSATGSTEKLSSGYRINRAADDAAGLAISEKMRKQIRGLDQASANAEDGISCVQTAEGALAEVQDMLQRMNELMVQAANGTNSETDRLYIQDEIDQLISEVDRVAETTKFNETYLLKGTNANGTEGALSYSTAVSNLSKMVTIDATTGSGSVSMTKVTSQSLSSSGTSGTSSVSSSLSNTVYNGYTVSINNVKYTIVQSTAPTSGVTTCGTTAEVVAELNKGQSSPVAFSSMDDLVAQLKKDFNTTGDIKSIDVSQDDSGNPLLTVNAFADLNNGVAVDLHVGADSSDDNKIKMNINMMSARGLGVNGLKVYGNNTENATKAIDVIADALQKVSTQRSSLGAIQNRLEHTIKNLDNVVENTTAAESQIRDTDMATEMVKYSNANIISQAGQSMLAQSNQANQGVLSLLG